MYYVLCTWILYMDFVYVLSTWILYMDFVYGFCIWILYMDFVYGFCMYMDFVYGFCIWILYIYGFCIWILYVHGFCMDFVYGFCMDFVYVYILLQTPDTNEWILQQVGIRRQKKRSRKGIKDLGLIRSSVGSHSERSGGGRREERERLRKANTFAYIR
jgi:hypothetical protein